MLYKTFFFFFFNTISHIHIRRCFLQKCIRYGREEKVYKDNRILYETRGICTQCVPKDIKNIEKYSLAYIIQFDGCIYEIIQCIDHNSSLYLICSDADFFHRIILLGWNPDWGPSIIDQFLAYKDTTNISTTSTTTTTINANTVSQDPYLVPSSSYHKNLDIPEITCTNTTNTAPTTPTNNTTTIVENNNEINTTSEEQTTTIKCISTLPLQETIERHIQPDLYPENLPPICDIFIAINGIPLSEISIFNQIEYIQELYPQDYSFYIRIHAHLIYKSQYIEYIHQIILRIYRYFNKPLSKYQVNTSLDDYNQYNLSSISLRCILLIDTSFLVITKLLQFYTINSHIISIFSYPCIFPYLRFTITDKSIIIKTFVNILQKFLHFDTDIYIHLQIPYSNDPVKISSLIRPYINTILIHNQLIPVCLLSFNYNLIDENINNNILPSDTIQRWLQKNSFYKCVYYNDINNIIPLFYALISINSELFSPNSFFPLSSIQNL